MSTVAYQSAPAPLLERDGELRAIERGFERLSRGSAGLLVIEGGAGIGKTSLLSALGARAAEHGVLALQARANVLESELPWSIVRQLLTESLIGADPARRVELMRGPAALSEPVLGLAEDLPDELDFSSALHGLYWLTRNLTVHQPLVMAIDDVQWSDRESAGYLAYLVHRLDEVRLLLAVSVRSGEPTGLPSDLDALHTSPAAVRLRPLPLSPGASHELVGRVLGESAGSELRARLHTESGGNPFLLRELCREYEQLNPVASTEERSATITVPERVAFGVQARLERFPPEAVEVAKAVAALGASATLSRAADLAQLSFETAAPAVAALQAAEILEARERPLSFAHPLVGQAVYEGTPAPIRSILHARAAELLRAEGVSPAEIAAHLLHAPPAGAAWRVSLLRRAAADARRQGAPASASRLLERALAEPPATTDQPEILRELGSADLDHDPRSAVTHLEAARRVTRDPASHAATTQLLAQAHALLTDFGAAVHVLGEEAEFMAGAPVEIRERIDSARLAFARWDHGSQDLRRALFEALRAKADRGEALDPLQSANLAHELAALGEDLPRAITHAQAAIASAPEARGTRAIWVLQLISVLLIADQAGEAEARTRAALTAAEQRGSPVDCSVAHTLAAQCALRSGRLADAIQHGRDSLDLASGVWNVGATAWLIEALAEQGHSFEVERLLSARGLDGDVAAASGTTKNLGFQMAVLTHHRGRARSLASAHELALEDLLRVGDLAAAWGVRNPAVLDWRSSAARSLLALGRRSEATELAEQELVLARGWGSATAVGVALSMAGQCGEGATGTERLQEAVAVLEAAPAALERGRALVALGMRLRRQRRSVDAREPLRRALDLAQACGSAVLAGVARDELVAAGGRPRRDALSGLAALTGRETRIAELCRSGLTNREIAQTLFLSPRTVEHHLGAVYRKLRISSRDELAAALDRGPAS